MEHTIPIYTLKHITERHLRGADIGIKSYTSLLFAPMFRSPEQLQTVLELTVAEGEWFGNGYGLCLPFSLGITHYGTTVHGIMVEILDYHIILEQKSTLE